MTTKLKRADKMIEIYSDREIMDYVRKISDDNLSRFTNVESIEWLAINRVAKYLDSPNGSLSHRRYIKRLIAREFYAGNGRKKELEVKKVVSTKIGLMDTVELLLDENTEVDEQLELKELIKYLSDGDELKRKILEEVVVIDSLNITDIARQLSDSNGKAVEANRKSIARALKSMRDRYNNWVKVSDN